jgi:hypothetical protein
MQNYAATNRPGTVALLLQPFERKWRGFSTGSAGRPRSPASRTMFGRAEETKTHLGANLSDESGDTSPENDASVCAPDSPHRTQPDQTTAAERRYPRFSILRRANRYGEAVAGLPHEANPDVMNRGSSCADTLYFLQNFMNLME